jgi:hypothetical protein
MRFSTSDTFPTNTSNAQLQQEWRNHASPHHAVYDILRPLLCFNLGYSQYGIPSCVPMVVKLSMITGSRSFLRTGLAWYDSNDSKYVKEYKYCTRRAFPSSPSTNNVLLDLACRQWTLPEIMVQLLHLLLLETKHHLRSKCCAPRIHGHTFSEEVLFLHFGSVTTSGLVLTVSPPSRWPASHRKFRFSARNCLSNHQYRHQRRSHLTLRKS